MAKKIETKPFGVQSTFNGNSEGGLNIIEQSKTVVWDVVEHQKFPELNNLAFSIIYNGKKKYSVVAIKFDAATNTTSGVETIASNLDLYEAQHEFKKATVNAGLFEIGLDK